MFEFYIIIFIHICNEIALQKEAKMFIICDIYKELIYKNLLLVEYEMLFIYAKWKDFIFQL